MILALRRDDIADLNRLARGKMLDGRRLGPEALIAGNREFRTGDRVVCLRNQRVDGLLNGLRGVVTALDPDAQSLTVRLTDGTDRAVPSSYLDAGHLDHGYAMTIHKAQGLTADEALILATDDLYQEAGYTALSRAGGLLRLACTSPLMTLTTRRRPGATLCDIVALKCPTSIWRAR